jgi:aryl-alcohol dehydrogenase-like predicted oxidoreductase
MELALGTVQFGLRYGVAGRGQAVPTDEVRDILKAAHARGIRTLDTAAAYGDIESRLAALADGLPFSIISKLPPCPAGLTAAEVTTWANAALTQSRARLGAGLRAVLFHRAEDLLDAHGEPLWAAATAFAQQHDLQLGVSCYEPKVLDRVRQRFAVQLAQLPGNALDQRLRTTPLASGAAVEIHLRSAFLQGLLLMPLADAARRVPAAAAPLQRWHSWCAGRDLDPLRSALGIAKGLPGVGYCVVGVDNLPQLQAIADAWAAAPVLHAADLHVDDLEVVDPRRWPA